LVGILKFLFNKLLLLQFCSQPQTSNKEIYSTFARTRPPDTQISRSVASVLIKFNWRKVVLLYSQSSDRDFSAVARTIQNTLESHNIEVRYVGTWSDTYHYGLVWFSKSIIAIITISIKVSSIVLYRYTENPFRSLVESTFEITRSKKSNQKNCVFATAMINNL